MQREEFERSLLDNMEEVEAVAQVTGVSVERLSESLAVICRQFGEVARLIGEAFGCLQRVAIQVWEGMGEVARKAEEERRKRRRFKRDFKRQEIRHQVACRRPKFVVRKIIH